MTAKPSRDGPTVGAAATPLGARLRRALRDPKHWILGSVILVIAYLSLVPLTFLAYETFTDSSGAFTLENLRSVADDPLVWPTIRTSFIFTFGSTALAMLIGTTLAYLHARTDISFKSVIFAVSLLPVFIPGLLFAVSWVQLAAPNTGILNLAIERGFGIRPLNIYTIWGMIWVEGTNLSPVVFLLMLAGFRSMDPSFEEAAVMSGARNSTTMRRVTFPLVKPAFLAAALLTVVRAFESFDIPAILGLPANIWVFTSSIWREMSRFPTNIGRVGAYSGILIALATVGVVFHNWYARKGGTARVQTIGGKAFRARPRQIRGGGRVAANLFVLLYILFVVGLPTIALVYSSLLPVNMAPSAEAFDRMSLENFRFVIDHPLVARSARNSVVLAISSATIAMFLASVASWIVVRTKVLGRGLLDNLAFMPIVYPGIVLGAALLFVYLRLPVPIFGTLLILLVAYVTKYLPFGMRYASTSMYQIHSEVEEAAHVSGASWWQAFRRVVLPLIVPGLLAGWIYIALISVRELASSILLFSPGTEVLSIALFGMWFEAQTNETAALGVMLIIGMLSFATIAYRIGSRFGIRAQEAFSAR